MEKLTNMGNTEYQARVDKIYESLGFTEEFSNRVSELVEQNLVKIKEEFDFPPDIVLPLQVRLMQGLMDNKLVVLGTRESAILLEMINEGAKAVEELQVVKKMLQVALGLSQTDWDQTDQHRHRPGHRPLEG